VIRSPGFWDDGASPGKGPPQVSPSPSESDTVQPWERSPAMIISHKFRFIFIKTVKTGGTSAEIALSKHLGRDDIITPISPEDEVIRQQLGYRGPQNCWRPIYRSSLRDVALFVLKRKRKLKYYNHIDAVSIKKYIGESIWNSYYKFCFSRNPWDRAISLYYWCHKSEPRPAFSDFIKSDSFRSIVRRGWDLFSIDGDVVVDRVCAYENFVAELEEVRQIVGIPEPLELPNAKSQYRRGQTLHPAELSRQDSELIQAATSSEIALMGYQAPTSAKKYLTALRNSDFTLGC
jgi:hypothetical protein